MKSGRTPLFRSLMRAMGKSQQPGISAKTRRDFLRLATVAGVGSALPLRGQEAAPAPTPASEEAPEKPKRKINGPVAIVGGGIGGLTAAYRLVKEGVEVHLYEMQNRWGGRMFTKRDFNKDGMFIELGGELVDTNHADLISLADELHVPLQSLKEGEKGVDFYYYNGNVYTDKDVIAAFDPLSKRIAIDVADLTDANGEFTDKARRLDNTSLKDYLQEAGSGTEPWLLELLETAYVPEFGRDTKFQSSLNFVDFINPDTSGGFQIFGDSDEAFRIQGGNDTLPTAVYNALQGKVTFHANHQLVKIGEDGSKIKLTFTNGGKVVAPSYEDVILTIPFTTMRNVQGIYDLKLSDEKKRSIKEMGFGTNIKIMYGFTGTPWRDEVAGRDFICNGSVYSDQPYQTIWETSRGQKGPSGIITNFMGGSLAEQYTTDRLDKFLAEIDVVFPGVKGKFDGNKIMMNWPQIKSMRGSYSCPLVGQYTWVYGAAATKEYDGHLLFAGEHTSFESPGYMNGGVESANRAVTQLFE